MKLFLDTNVLLDYLLRRPEHGTISRNLFVMHTFGDAELWASAKSFTDIFYIAGKAIGSNACQDLMAALVTKLHICSIGEGDVSEALEDRWDDFEDRLILQAAKKVGADAIVTRNQHHFGRSTIPVIMPAELLGFMEREHNLAYEEVSF